MTFFVRLTATLVLAATVFSSVSAHVVEGRHGGGGFSWGGHNNNNNNNNNNNGCGSHEFRFRRGKADCCLPKGGIGHPPTPPPEHECPTRNYYWSPEQKCCVPQDEPDDDDEPECPSNCKWNHNDQFCQPDHPHNPIPSGHWSNHGGNGGWGNGNWGNGNWGNGNWGNGNWHKRGLKSRAEALCPSGLSACPISGLTGEYECLDVSAELESCGGCVSLGQGQDCTAIPGAWNVGCEMGSCAVYTCQAGYSLSADKKSCVPL